MKKTINNLILITSVIFLFSCSGNNKHEKLTQIENQIDSIFSVQQNFIELRKNKTSVEANHLVIEDELLKQKINLLGSQLKELFTDNSNTEGKYNRIENKYIAVASIQEFINAKLVDNLNNFDKTIHEDGSVTIKLHPSWITPSNEVESTMYYSIFEILAKNYNS